MIFIGVNDVWHKRTLVRAPMLISLKSFTTPSLKNCRKKTLRLSYARRLPLEKKPIRVMSWMVI